VQAVSFDISLKSRSNTYNCQRRRLRFSPSGL